MEWTWDDVKKILGGGAVITALLTFLGNALGIIRFRKKDVAETKKVESETANDFADIRSKSTEDEIKISKAALEWTVQLAGQLEKANAVNEKRQAENERLHSVIDTMKKDFAATITQMQNDFNKRIKELEEALEDSQNALAEEAEKYKLEISKLRAQIDGTGRL